MYFKVLYVLNLIQHIFFLKFYEYSIKYVMINVLILCKIINNKCICFDFYYTHIKNLTGIIYLRI